MATQCVRVTVVLLMALLSVASPAAINLGTSLGDGDDMNQVKADDLEVSVDFDDLLGRRKSEDRSLPADEEGKPYVDASVFRQPTPGLADAVKPKASFFVKKALPEASKHAKDEHDAKKAISTRLEPPMVVDAIIPEEEANERFTHILTVLRRIIEVTGQSIVRSLKTQTTTAATPDDLETTTTTASTPTTTTTVATSSGTTSAPPPANEDEELPRLSPPIWSHSSEAEALSDPLRLPLVEPYDRYDRYSHSIARDLVW